MPAPNKQRGLGPRRPVFGGVVALAVAAHAAALMGMPTKPASAVSSDVQAFAAATPMQSRLLIESPKVIAANVANERSGAQASLTEARAARATAKTPSTHVSPTPSEGSPPAALERRVDSVSEEVAESTDARYDLPPMPRDGWTLNSTALLGFPPGGPTAIALIEVAVDAQGAITEWRLVETNADRRVMLSALQNLQDTVMMPARLAGEPLAARFSAELAFTD